ncbi:hypothetical protein Are01nite_53770 [Actinoplanes regularis]|nr:hypothetical protein Are01nite_53770 [Actinoplanes regularis]
MAVPISREARAALLPCAALLPRAALCFGDQPGPGASRRYRERGNIRTDADRVTGPAERHLRWWLTSAWSAAELAQAWVIRWGDVKEFVRSSLPAVPHQSQ